MDRRLHVQGGIIDNVLRNVHAQGKHRVITLLIYHQDAVLDK